MMKQHGFKVLWISLLVFALPTSQLYAAAMISTEAVVSDISSERDRIENFMHRSEVEKKLVELGVSKTEALHRVASLSDEEVRDVAGHLDQLHAGGDGIYIGLGGLILLIILIYILARH